MDRVKYVQRATNKEVDLSLNRFKLTKIQEDILSRRVDIDILKEFDYEVSDLINSKFDPMKNIHRLPDIELAGELIAKAIREKKHILIVNDFDSDGVNSGAVLFKALEKIFHVKDENFGIIINKRRTGTGYSRTLTKRIIDYHNNVHKIDMILSSDHGSNDEASFKQLKEAGVGDLIITDHHHVDNDNYPDSAAAFINPQRSDSTYYKEVSGCFVAFITMVMAYKKLHGVYRSEHFNILLPYVALSTVTDVMSMKYPINRQVVKVGLNIMNSFKHTTWIAIKKVLKLKNRITSYDLGFKIGPLINTANRMDIEELALSVMIENDYDELYKFTQHLYDMVVIKKASQAAGTKQAMSQVSSLKEKNSVVVAIDSEYAINGIIAGMVGGRVNRPTVCFINIDSDVMPGSGRGINPNVDLVSIYNKINEERDDILVKFGGHKLAAGCAIYKDKLDVFRELFDKYVVEQLGEHQDNRTIEFDIQLPLDKISLATTKELLRMLPYGKDWTEPLLYSKLIVSKILVFGTVCKLFFRDSNGYSVDGITFFNNTMTGVNAENIKTLIKPNDRVHVTYTLGLTTNRDIAGVNMVINTIEKEE